MARTEPVEGLDAFGNPLEIGTLVSFTRGSNREGLTLGRVESFTVSGNPRVGDLVEFVPGSRRQLPGRVVKAGRVARYAMPGVPS